MSAQTRPGPRAASTDREKGDYLYIAIGKDAVWMRNYLKGL